MNKKTSLLILVFVSIVIFSSKSFGSEEIRTTTGKVTKISQNNVQLSLSTGMIHSIGFSCKPNDCPKSEDFKIGERVILYLGSRNNKNVLINIKKCIIEKSDCSTAEIKQKRDKEKKDQETDIFFAKQEKCHITMQADLQKDNRYVPKINNKTEYSTSIRKYTSLIKNKQLDKCISKIINDHQQAVYDSCIKYQCGKDIGGGCSHIAGYSIHSSVLSRAEEACKI